MMKVKGRSVCRTAIGSVAVFALLIASFRPAWAQAKQGTPMGSLFTPAHTPEGITTLEDVQLGLLQTASFGGHISHMHDWREGDKGLDHIASLTPLFRQLGFKVFLQLAATVLGEPNPPDGLPRSFADPQARTRYLSDVARLAAFKPDYLNLCAEVDLIFLLSPANAAAYASLYKDAYQVVKSLSPSTHVGVSYHMDVFFGREMFWVPSYLGPQDYIGFTTYPSWVVHEAGVPGVGNIPSAYYDRVRVLFPSESVVFSEVGWPSAGAGTPQEQAAFIRELPRLLQGVRPELVTWSTLCDTHYFQLSLLSEAQLALLRSLNVDPQALFDQLNSMGIIDWNGVPKPGYEAALNLVF